MAEYYRLSLLKETKIGTGWEEIYLRINGEKSGVIGYKSPQERPLNSKLEKISDEEALIFLCKDFLARS